MLSLIYSIVLIIVGYALIPMGCNLEAAIVLLAAVFGLGFIKINSKVA